MARRRSPGRCGRELLEVAHALGQRRQGARPRCEQVVPARENETAKAGIEVEHEPLEPEGLGGDGLRVALALRRVVQRRDGEDEHAERRRQRPARARRFRLRAAPRATSDGGHSFGTIVLEQGDRGVAAARSGSNGLATKRSAPAWTAASSDVDQALITITGVSAKSRAFRSSRSTSRPLRPGSIRSSTIRSGCVLPREREAARPVGRLEEAIIVVAEGQPHECAQVRIVLTNEDRLGGGLGCGGHDGSGVGTQRVGSQSVKLQPTAGKVLHVSRSSPCLQAEYRRNRRGWIERGGDAPTIHPRGWAGRQAVTAGLLRADSGWRRRGLSAPCLRIAAEWRRFRATSPFFPWPPEHLREFVLEHDVDLRKRRQHGEHARDLARTWVRLRSCARRGRPAIVLTGWSAGMICWFEAGVTDSFGPQLEGMHDGLGFLAGSACPHYDGEGCDGRSTRGSSRDGFPPGVAADDGVVLHYDGNGARRGRERARGRRRLPRGTGRRGAVAGPPACLSYRGALGETRRPSTSGRW